MATYHLSILVLCLVAASNSNPTGRVKGGQDAKQGEFPYHVSLRKLAAAPICGGSLVVVNSTQVIVTSGRCLKNAPESVLAGDLTLSDVSGIEQARVVSARVPHPGFNMSDTSYDYDIGLIFLNRPFDINDNIAPIALPPPTLQNPTGNVLITGWGNSSVADIRGMADVLQKVEVPVVDETRCKATHNDYDPLTSFCTGVQGKGGCAGDGGGPLTLPDAKYLVAVSLGYWQCGDPDEPALNTNVAAYVDWIEQEVARHCEYFVC